MTEKEALHKIDQIFDESGISLEESLKKALKIAIDNDELEKYDDFLDRVVKKSIRFRESKIGKETTAKKEWEIIIELLEKTDLGLFMRVSRKMMFFLCRIGIPQARVLLESFGVAKESGNIESIYDSNKPSQKKDMNSIISLNEKTFSIASYSISDEEILSNIQKWIKEDRLNFLVKTLKNLDSSLSDILNAIIRYHLFVPEKIEFTPYLKENINVLLINRFLTDQLEFISIAKNYVEIDDFYQILRHTIAPSDSHGKIGGKGAGYFLAEKILKRTKEYAEYKDFIKSPKTWFISSDTFQYFLYYNNLEELVEQKYKDIEQIRDEYPNIIQIIKNAYFPPEIIQGLSLALDDFGERPIVVRSSSLLEDRLGSAFSGKYKSLFLGNQGTKSERLAALMDAVSEVYASIYGPDPLGYRKEKGLLDFSEEMAVMIQEVVGIKIEKYFLPPFAGVAFSFNEFQWSPRVKREDGLLRMVLGLGTRAVDRLGDDYPMMISPGQPNIRVSITPEEIYKYSLRKIDVINLENNSFETIDINVFLKKYGNSFPDLDLLVSVHEDGHIYNKQIFEIDFEKDDLVLTFEGLLSKTPFVKQVNKMIEILDSVLKTPVDIEFVSDGKYFYIVQCRPQCSLPEYLPSPIPKDLSINDILFTAKKYISNGKISNVSHIVYIKPESYHSLESLDDLKSVGKAVGKLNTILPKRQFILMGPGRWGSRGDIKLGINVSYSDINNNILLIEIARKTGNYLPDLSFGTHFFQDLVESSIRYLPLYPDDFDIIFNERFLIESKNALPDLLPEYAHLKDTIYVIDIPKETDGKKLNILMNSELSEAIAYFAITSDKEFLNEKFDFIVETQSENHWIWRLKMSENIAKHIDLEKYGVSGLYIFGSTKNANAGPNSDIDLLIHFSGNEFQKNILLSWLEGWSRCLSEINYLRTGYRVEDFLDIHIVSDEDIEKQTDLSKKINAVTDAARPLKLK